MNIRKTAIITVSAIVLAASAYAAAHSPISQRKAAMKEIGGQMRSLGGMAQGKTAYDDFAVFSAVEIMLNNAIAARPLFADSMDMGEETRAKPEIWAAGSDFDAQMGQMINALQATLDADPADLDSFLPLFGAIAATCKSCHEKYRAPES